MNKVASIDGTVIAYEKTGAGKPLIIIGGSLADHQMYIPLANELSKKLTIFNYDRRNRGKSGISASHDIETELKDLESLINLCETTPVIYGHSAGAALSIWAVAEGLNIDKLILSDLPYTPITDNSEQDVYKFSIEQSKIVEFLNQNDKVGAVKFFLKDFGMNEHELEEFISSKSGEQAVSNVITLPIDYELLGNGLTPKELLRKVHKPTLVLSSNDGLAVADDVAQYIADCKIAVLENPTYRLSANEIAKPIFDFIEETE